MFGLFPETLKVSKQKACSGRVQSTMLNSMRYFVAIACYLILFLKAENAFEKAQNPNTVVCHGPRGHRGHRGPLGDRGPVGDTGAPGRNGTDAVDRNLDMIELWSTDQYMSGAVFFTNARMTAGFSIQDPISAITVESSGLYMIYYYILDTEAYFETYLDDELQYVINASQFNNDQIWYQYPLYISAGQVVRFQSPFMSLPYSVPTFPEAASGVLYSVSLQLIIP